MDAITEFLSSINIWLAVALVDFSIFFVVYVVLVCFNLVMNTFTPKDYTEKNDYFYSKKEPVYYDLSEFYPESGKENSRQG